MKYIKTYEYDTLEYQNFIYKLLKSIVKIVNKKYTVYLSPDNKIQILNKNNIQILNKNVTVFTEIISIIYVLPNTIKFEIYSTNYELNNLLIKFFSNSMETTQYEEYKYSFRFNHNTKLNIEDFKLLININNYNI